MVESEGALLNGKQVAAMLKISPRKLWEMTKAGAIPSVRIGGSLRYREAAILAWLKDLETGPGCDQ